jgi:hypothetical protein
MDRHPAPATCKEWAAILTILAAVGALVFPFMASRVDEREIQCREKCSARGYAGYRYVPSRGAGRRVSMDDCTCLR